MRQAAYFETGGGIGGRTSLNSAGGGGGVGRIFEAAFGRPRQLIIGLILLFSLVAFELFNFDTTRFALESLLGEVTFFGLGWAAILAIAFCAIDFAGLARLFTPEQSSGSNPGAPKELWYLTGAWLLGATMNAVMTWWAVSLALLEHDLGNEILSREELLSIAPIFVAALVWLTRILFIGALTVAGERLAKSRAGNRKRASANAAAPLRLRRNEKPSLSQSRSQSRPRRRTIKPSPIDLSQPVEGSASSGGMGLGEMAEAPYPATVGSASQSNGHN